MQKKIHRKLFVFEIIICELVAPNFPWYKDNACHGLTNCSERVLGYCVLLEKTFSNAPTFKVFNEYFKCAAIHIATVLQCICHVVCLRVL